MGANRVEDIGSLITMILQGMFNTWETMRNITFLNTNLLQFCIAIVIANALVKLMVVTNKVKIDNGGKGDKK